MNSHSSKHTTYNVTPTFINIQIQIYSHLHSHINLRRTMYVPYPPTHSFL